MIELFLIVLFVQRPPCPASVAIIPVFNLLRIILPETTQSCVFPTNSILAASVVAATPPPSIILFEIIKPLTPFCADVEFVTIPPSLQSLITLSDTTLNLEPTELYIA